MKYIFIGLFFLSCFQNIASQNKPLKNRSKGLYKKDNTTLKSDPYISSEDSIKFTAQGFVTYYDFGAAGDGKTDDLSAIAKTHTYANKHSLNVKANTGANYYIGGKNRSVIIQTHTDFGQAKFIIDDTNVQYIKAPIFIVKSNKKAFHLQKPTSLKKGQKKLKLNLEQPSIVTAKNHLVKHYIRYGLNKNNGAPQTDIFIVNKKGKIDKTSPIIWDFNNITTFKALPIDEEVLTITGGHFTTIANQAPSKYTYYNRNISVRRSHVVIDGLKHMITGEGSHGAPYDGFINIRNCAYVTVKNSTLTGHKTYQTIGRAKKPVSMGSYDITVNRSLNVSFINCNQSNNINDKNYWGIMASNYSKNLRLDHCSFSRFDAHKGVFNATINHSIIGHMGIKAIGSGTLRVENTTVHAQNFISLRKDYGSSWQGNIIIKNAVFAPINHKEKSNLELIDGSYSGNHNFGYQCYMPKRITIKHLLIDDSKFSKTYDGPFVFKDFNATRKNSSYKEAFPYVLTDKVYIKNMTSSNGKKITLSKNKYMFKDVKLVIKN